MIDQVEQTPLKVLIACEWTGTVRRAFDRLGHDVWSCDKRPAADGSNRHICDDVRNHLNGWDLLIVAHPPCTRLCNSGVRWLEDPSKLKNLGEDFNDDERLIWPEMSLSDRRALMQVKLQAGAALFSDLWNAPCDRIAVENPVMHKHGKALIRNYEPQAQSVQPWQFGDWESKRTCLWLRGLPTLKPTYRKLEDARAGLGLDADDMPDQRVFKLSPGADRGRERSKFFDGIANAMAEQWGGYALGQIDAVA